MMIMDSSKPLYLQVEADIKNRILSKQYMPGDKLPTENELSDQYNVSKITIRKAIQNLSDEGYVNKVQGKGTFINFKKDKLYLNKTSGFKESLSSLGHASRHDIIQASFLNADEDIAEKLMIPMGTKVVYIERLVWQDNEPIAIDKIYIEDARFPDFITTLSKDRSFYQVMDECYHIRPNHSVLEIDGKAAQSHSADTLKCNVGDPLFSIHKISYDQDGKDAVFCVDPDEATIAAAHEMQARAAEQKRLLANYKGRPSVTKSGRKVNVYANIGSVSDVAYVQENDAEGIGLFRSEFLYLGKTALPDETEQFNTYRQVLQTMGGKKVIIRTLDIGADKNVDYLGLGKEDNPAMGYRAIRICLKQPDVFKTQLRALLRAAKYGNLAIMYPMIISVDEVLRIREIVAEVAAELKREQIPYAIPEQGIMIETPAAVMICEELAELVDFFSIGTNDLTQYTLAIDRQNEKLDEFYNPHHEAVLRMIQMTIDGAHKAGKWAGICGELGADTTLTERFVEMGIDELSVAPSMVLSVRSKICEMA